jgi:ribose transport system permease protein
VAATDPKPATGVKPQSLLAKITDLGGVQMRFTAIWLALVLLIILGLIFQKRSVDITAILSILPFAAFLAMASMGQAMVLMARGIDLSVPSIIMLSSTILLGVSGGQDAGLGVAIVAALGCAMLVGIVNGALIAVLKLNALIVTLAVGAIVAGLTIWIRQDLQQEANVPVALADFGSARLLGINSAVWIAAGLAVLLHLLLRRTVMGRKFEAMGVNPRTAHTTGLKVMLYQGCAYIVAALLYGIVGVLLSGFIRNPTLEVGAPYLLAPIAAAVLGGTAISGGIGSMIAVVGASLFLVQLGQMLRIMGLSTAHQFIIEGVAIALGMWLSSASGKFNLTFFTRRFGKPG